MTKNDHSTGCRNRSRKCLRTFELAQIGRISAELAGELCVTFERSSGGAPAPKRLSAERSNDVAEVGREPVELGELETHDLRVTPGDRTGQGPSWTGVPGRVDAVERLAGQIDVGRTDVPRQAELAGDRVGDREEGDDATRGQRRGEVVEGTSRRIDLDRRTAESTHHSSGEVHRRRIAIERENEPMGVCRLATGRGEGAQGMKRGDPAPGLTQGSQDLGRAASGYVDGDRCLRSAGEPGSDRREGGIRYGEDQEIAAATVDLVDSDGQAATFAGQGLGGPPIPRPDLLESRPGRRQPSRQAPTDPAGANQAESNLRHWTPAILS